MSNTSSFFSALKLDCWTLLRMLGYRKEGGGGRERQRKWLVQHVSKETDMVITNCYRIAGYFRGRKLSQLNFVVICESFLREIWAFCPLAWQKCSLVPRPPLFFCSSVCIQYNTRKQKSAKNGEGLGTPITWMMSGGHEVDMGGGWCPITSTGTINKRSTRDLMNVWGLAWR